MAKHLDIARMLGKRILRGDYVLEEFPTDRDLAAEIGASTVTARKAVQRLIDQKLLIRRPNGRPAVSRKRRDRSVIALLSVSYPSPVSQQWQRLIDQLTRERGWLLRTVGYSHYEDPVIKKAIENFDGIFFVPSSDDPPDFLTDQLRDSPRPVIVLGQDWTSWGVRALWLIAPTAVQQLLDYLRSQGHRRIACLNTQPTNKVIRQRIEQWQLWMAAYGQAAPLINEPVKPFEPASWQAHRVIKQRLAGDGLQGATALYCVTGAAARGAMRAFHERNLKVGRDIALCSADDDGGEMPLWVPSITSIQEADSRPYLSVCLDWMARNGRGWLGPMLVQPAQSPLFIGESIQINQK